MHLTDKAVNRPDKPIRTLIVDDSAGMRIYLKAILSAVGFTCAEAGDGAEAFDLVLASDFDLVVTDIEMPGMDGLEFLSALKLLPAGRKRPRVIVCSAQADELRQSRRRELDLAAALLSKPVSAEALMQAVESALA
jgi:CheY-like chemotaxis protein